MEPWLWILLAALCFECRGEDKVMQQPEDVVAAEGDTVTLDCTFQTTDTNLYLFWYKQEGTSRPQFILSRFKGDKGKTEDEFKERFSSTVNSTMKSAPLKIQELQLSDSAVYYCALSGVARSGLQKLQFGSGTKLVISDGDQYQPSFYKLKHGNTSACLATGFSRFHQLQTNTLFSQSEAVLISQDSLFNQVAFMDQDADGETSCPEDENEGAVRCDDALQPDPLVNLVSLMVTGLRVLLLKTMIFNILMTLRLRISQ
eukprot:XP_011619014.1 PREDICTED: uncharacterized protein LOC101074543 [Takifugu rubripes]